MGVKINTLNNANIYLNGTDHIGKASEITMPELKFKMKEHEGLGLFGDLEFPVGLEKMDAKIKWNSYYPEVMRVAGNPFQSNTIQVRSSLEERAPTGLVAQMPVVAFIVGTWKTLPLGSFKKGDPTESETEINVQAVKLQIDGQQILEIDVLANIYKVGGVDILQHFKANIGQGQGISRESILTNAAASIPGLMVM